MYASPQNLIDRFDAQEIAQIAVPKELVSIDANLLILLINDGDRSSYSAEEQASAYAALTKIEQAINDAEGDIDSHLEARYQLPLQSVPLKLEQVCCDIARYNLYDNHPTEHISKRYDDAIKYLVKASKGQINIGIAEDTSKPAAAENVVEFESDGHTFKRENSTDFI